MPEKENREEMATGAAPDGLLRYVYEGSIVGEDTGINRRPYHRNCGCALHNKSQGKCPHGLKRGRCISYPIRRSFSEGCLVMAAGSCNSSPSSSPAVAPTGAEVGGRRRFEIEVYKDEDEEHAVSFKI